MSRTNLDVTPQPSRAWHVAILEDDTQLRECILVPGLRYFGFEVTGAENSADLYRCMLAQDIDIVVLDIGLSDEDGLTVLNNLREFPKLGVVMLTANTDLRSHLTALANGADAFLNKPVDVEVLAATLHSVARRVTIQNQEQDVANGPGEWHLTTEDWCLVTPTGKAVPLTASERCILRILMAECNRPITRESLINALTSDIYGFDPRRIEMMVHRLRRKAQAAADMPFPLITLRGHGYLFQARPDR